MTTQIFRATFSKLTIAAGVLTMAMAAAAPAHADVVYSWTFNGYVSNPSAGNQLSFTATGSPTEILLARSYATANVDGTGAFQAAGTTLWSGGLGVKAPGESNESSSPNHAIDNNGKDNFLLLEFDSNYHRLTSFQIGWRSGDSDVQIWVGGPATAGLNLTTACGGACSVSQLASLGFTQLPVFENSVLTPSSNAVATGVVGRYMLVAGQSGEYDDYFKLAGVTNVEVEVPEPGTLALAGAGLAALWVVRRRRERRAA